MSLPNLTVEERTAALEKASEIRRQRAELCGKIKTGQLKVSDVFAMSDDGDVVAGKLRARRLIESVPGMGKMRTEQFMDKERIAPGRRVRGLGSRQRRIMAEAFDSRAAELVGM